MSKISELSDGTPLVSSDYLIAVRSGGNVKVRLTSLNIDQITLGDNEMIRLGNSQDLTMVHTSTQSIINQAGVGDLLLQKAGTTKASITANGLEFPDNSKAIFGAGSDLSIYSDGTTGQVTGNVNVTGSVTADGLTVDGAFSFSTSVDGVINSPSALYLNFDSDNNSAGEAFVIGSNRTGGSGGNEHFRVNASGNVGINTSSPSTYDSRSNNLVVGDSGDAGITIFSGATSNARLQFAPSGDTGLNNGLIDYDNNDDSMAFATGGSYRMRIDSAGNTSFTLGTNAMGTFNDAISEVGSGNFALQVTNSAGSALKPLGFRAEDIRFATGSAERLRITSTGYVEMAGAADVRLTLGSQGTAGNNDANWIRGNGTSLSYNAASANHIWETGGIEKARLDSWGLLVGTTDSAPYDNSANSAADNGIVAGAGLFAAARYQGSVGLFNRTGNDGEILGFKRSGAAVGLIGSVSGGKMSVIGTNQNLQIGANGANVFNVSTTSVYPATDNATDLGFSSSIRWKDLYLSGQVFANVIGRSNDTNTTIDFPGSDVIQFFTAGSERLTIDASGHLLVGASVKETQGVTVYGNGANGLYSATTSTSAYWVTNLGITSATGVYFSFYNNATYSGGITITSTNVTNYTSVSDERLKENIADADDSGSKIDSIQVRKFDWKSGGEHQDYGFIAQELVGVAPDAVTTPEDPEEMMSVDPAKLVPMMLKEIQSLRARIAALES